MTECKAPSLNTEKKRLFFFLENIFLFSYFFHKGSLLNYGSFYKHNVSLVNKKKYKCIFKATKLIIDLCNIFLYYYLAQFMYQISLTSLMC